MKYLILIGKFNEYGFCNSNNSYFETNDLKLAEEKFTEQVAFEKKTIKDWHLRPTDYVEVALVEYKEDIEDYEYHQVVHLNRIGEEI